MKTINYNNKEILIGSIAEDNEVISKHLVLPIGESDIKDPNYQKFNCSINELNNFIALTKDKECLIDVGCQFGIFSYSFLGNDKNKKVYAFDGGIIPYLVTTQIKLINNLDNLYCFNFFIGDDNKQIRCSSESLQSLAIPGNDTKQMFTIDTLCFIFNIQPDVIKIDIEGSELMALYGSINAIHNYKPIIFIEIHPRFLTMYNNTIHDIVEFFNKIDYEVFDLLGNKVENYLDILKQEKTDSNRTVWKPKK